VKVVKAVIQFVMATKRFQPRAVVAEDIGERDDEVGGSL
jgi:hypothetical protein